MIYSFVPMNREYATRIVDTWKYPGEYSIYDYSNEADHMLDSEGWGSGLFAVLDQDGELIGELSLEFYDKEGNYTDFTRFTDMDLINQRELWIGFGLRPDLTGRGLGGEFVSACGEYAVRQTRFNGEYIRLGVAKFNQRAIKAYENAGFEVYETTHGTIAGSEFECVHMRKYNVFTQM